MTSIGSWELPLNPVATRLSVRLSGLVECFARGGGAQSDVYVEAAVIGRPAVVVVFPNLLWSRRTLEASFLSDRMVAWSERNMHPEEYVMSEMIGFETV